MTKKDITINLIVELLALRNSLPINEQQNKLLTKIANYMRSMQAEIDIANVVKKEKPKKLKKLIDEPAGCSLLTDEAYAALQENEYE
jgi:hypothetical protein